IGRRLASGLITLFGIVVVAFFLARLTGNPALLYLPEGATEEMFVEFNRQNGYDRPLIVQFISFLGDLLRLDFGRSASQQRPAAQAALEAMPPTFVIVAMALFIMMAISLVFGSIAALHPFSRTDKTITFLSLGVSSVPDFWLGLVGILVFAVHLRWVPTSGQGSAAAWILPLITLSIPPSGTMIQIVRGAMIEALGSGYVQNARARGYGLSRLAFRHALRNAALPIITVAGDRAAHLINGTIIISTIFAWPGIGAVLIQAVITRDFALLQACVFFTGLAIITLNLLIDIAYAFVDPRVRVS
ncbi:MAG: ABC transporter permease, partial [Rhodobacteraceae bacterium]|nr:ABC transporter permease [Paracoccaceae bacterium]